MVNLEVNFEMTLGQLLAFPATAEIKEPLQLPQVASKTVEPADHFFTYGSLMRGQVRNAILEREVFVGEAYLDHAKLYDTDCGFPALFLGGVGKVWGEVYKIIHPETWAYLDRVEGNLYHRVARRVTVPGRTPSLRNPLVQLYVGNPEIWDVEALKRIEDGRWEHA